MLFLLDSTGVPSVAQFIQLSPYATTPPSGAITSPTSDITIPAGSMVSFSTTSSAAKYSWVFPGGSPATSTLQNPGNVVFNTPGTYVASLTVIDSSGNSDPSPPTRTITVLPTSADFSIVVSPSSQAVIPGQSTNFTVTVSPLSGFNGAVTLSVGSENGFPSGITSGGFTPSSITGSGSSTLTINTTTSATPYALSLTITGTAGTITHTASTTLLVNLAAPASLTATPGNAQVSLSWPASVGATSYDVKRATVSGGPYTTVACATTTSYTDTGLTGGTTYYYVVSAAYSAGPNAGGESADSSEASATPQGLARPSAPAVLTATPGNGQVALSWSASSGATSYNVKRATVSGGPYTTIASPSSTSYTNSGLTNGTTYYYVVSAVNSAGESGNSSQVSATPQPRLTNGTTYYYVVSAVNSAGESGNSSQVSATPQPPAAPAAPTNVTASSGPPKGGVTLRWTQSTTPGVTQNYIYRRPNPGSYPSAPTVKISAATSYVDTKLNSGNSYCYQVTAVSSGGESPKSNEACANAK